MLRLPEGLNVPAGVREFDPDAQGGIDKMISKIVAPFGRPLAICKYFMNPRSKRNCFSKRPQTVRHPEINE
jgi:hypothetical protein